jgi:hypothetical protein
MPSIGSQIVRRAWARAPVTSLLPSVLPPLSFDVEADRGSNHGKVKPALQGDRAALISLDPAMAEALSPAMEAA